MGLINNMADEREFIYRLLGGGDERRWNEIVSWLESDPNASILDVRNDGVSFAAGGGLSSAAALTFGNGMPRYIMPSGSQTDVYMQLGIPGWWDHLTLGFDWVNDHTATGTVNWAFELKGFNVTTLISTATVFHSSTPTVNSPAANGGHITQVIGVDIPITHNPNGTLWNLRMSRLTGGTLAGPIGLAECVFARSDAP